MADRSPSGESAGFGGGRQLDRKTDRLLQAAESFAGETAAGAAGAGATTTDDGSDAVVSFRGVTTTIEGNRALAGLDLDLPTNQLTAVIGAAGPAKTALVEHIQGSRIPDDGEVRVLGTEIRDMTEEELLTRSQRIGVVLRGGGLFSSMSVYDNIALLLRTEGGELTSSEVDAAVQDQLEALGLGERAAAMPGDLGRTQRIRVGLARALALRPYIVLLDEPEAGLDPSTTAMVGEMIGWMHSTQGGTWIVLTSSFDLARQIAGHIVLMRRGRAVAAGSLRELQASNNPHVRALLGAATPPQ